MSLTRNKRLTKLGNAVRAFRGSKYTSGKWFRPPQMMVKGRIYRWAFRCYRANDISKAEELKLRAL